MKKILEVLEYGFTILALILYSGAIFTLFISGGASEGELEGIEVETTLIKQIFLVFYVITIGLLGCRWQKTLYVASKNIYVFLFTGLAIISIIWSSAPEITINRAIAIFGTNLFGLYLASRYTLKQQLLLLSQAFGIIVVLSILLIILLPKYGIMGGSHVGAWRGVFSHKNGLGKWMVLSTAIFFLQSISYPSKNILMYFGVIFSIILSVGSRSTSSMTNLLLVMLVLLVMRTWRWRYEIMVPVSLVIILLSSGLFIWFNDNSSLVFANLGKDPSLTGRADLWLLAWDMGWKKPLLGYGYGAFWNELNGAAANIWSVLGWHAPNGHNGFLDLFLSLGLSGIIILGLSFFTSFVRAFICLRYSKTSDGFWPLILMIYFLVSNLTESSLMIQNDLFTVTYVAISYSMAIHNNAKAKSLVYGEPFQA